MAAAARSGRKSFALALGGGGARGLCHIAVIEALDDLGIRPVAIAGVSVGALVGAAYAAGLTGRAIRRHVIDLAHNRSEIWRRLMGARAVPWSAILSSPLGNPVLIDAEKFAGAFLPDSVPETFEALAIPLTVIATDLHARRDVSLHQGVLRPAVAASCAIPGLLRPVMVEGRVLVDGAAVDPLPYGALAGRADIVIAVDCTGERPESAEIPNAWEALFATITVMGETILAAKLRDSTPDLILRPPVGIFRLLDFMQASAILRASEPIKAEIKAKLPALLGL